MQKFDFKAYHKQYDICWKSNLDEESKLSAAEKVIYETLYWWMVDLIDGITVDKIKDNFYIDFPYREECKAFGMSAGTVNTAMAKLKEKGLVSVNRGGKNQGVSRIYFPLVIPLPTKIKPAPFYKNYYKGKNKEVEDKVLTNYKFQLDVEQQAKLKQINFTDIVVIENDSFQEKRVKLGNIFYGYFKQKNQNKELDENKIRKKISTVYFVLNSKHKMDTGVYIYKVLPKLNYNLNKYKLYELLNILYDDIVNQADDLIKGMPVTQKTIELTKLEKEQWYMLYKQAKLNGKGLEMLDRLLTQKDRFTKEQLIQIKHFKEQLL